MTDYQLIDRDELKQLNVDIITKIEPDKLFDIIYLSSNNITYVCGKVNRDIVYKIRFKQLKKRIINMIRSITKQ